MRYILILIAVLLAFSPDALADDVDRVDAAIKDVVEFGIPKHNIKPNKRNKMYRNDGARRELAEAIVHAGSKYDVPYMLLVAISYREGSFVGNKNGLRGEESTFQVVPRVAATIRLGRHPWSDIAEPGCNLQTTMGSALCAAALLRIHVGKCKTIEGALMYYATGDTCKWKKGKLRWIGRDRFGIARFLDLKFPGE